MRRRHFLLSVTVSLSGCDFTRQAVESNPEMVFELVVTPLIFSAVRSNSGLRPYFIDLASVLSSSRSTDPDSLQNNVYSFIDRLQSGSDLDRVILVGREIVSFYRRIHRANGDAADQGKYLRILDALALAIEDGANLVRNRDFDGTVIEMPAGPVTII